MMKDLLKISLVIFLFSNASVAACDICNSSATNTNSFNLGRNRNFIGLVYNHLNYAYKENIVLDNSTLGHDYINPIRLIGNYNIKKRLNFTVSVPYLFLKRETSKGETINQSGLGDISFSSSYDMFYKIDNHSLQLGIGVKAPSGDFSIKRFRQTANQTSANQLGTGSWDIFFPISYGLKVDDLSITTQASYFLKGENEDHYRFGDQLSVQLKASYPIVKENNTLVGAISTMYDTFNSFSRFDIEEPNTDGELFTSELELQYNFSSIVFGINYRFPLNQDLVNDNVRLKQGFGLFTFYQF